MNKRNIKRDAMGRIIAVRKNKHSFWLKPEDYGIKVEGMEPMTYGPIVDGLKDFDLDAYARQAVEENVRKTEVVFDYSKPRFLLRMQLLFVGKRTKIIPEVGGNYLMEYKNFKGILYVTKFEQLPAEHPNCKLDIEFLGGDYHVN